VQKLSSVYRYVLANKDKETVLLNEELDFIKSYIYLNKIRFGDNLRTEIDVNTDCLGFSIPTLTLQMLIENCIKHNVISQSKPLQIYIGCVDGYVYVKNNLQPKILVGESSGIGLNNIISRYDYLSKKEVIIEKTETEFSVKVPLI
jgi:LytS/YehU family sensor histidine kinase